jgi:ABC-type spermidine/putrescine transport system permease subunit II
MAPSDLTAARRRSRLGRTLLFLACAPILLLLVLPSLIIVPMALTKGDLIQFPPIWISLHSFTDYLCVPRSPRRVVVQNRRWWPSAIYGSTAAIAMHDATSQAATWFSA